MDKVLDFIERHKIGILVTIVVHLAVFLYFQIGTFKEAVIYEPWDFKNINEESPDDIEVSPEQIQTKEEQNLFKANEEVTSFVKNEDDTREKSRDKNINYTSYSSSGDPEQIEKDYEESLKDEIQKNKPEKENQSDKNTTDLDENRNEEDTEKSKTGDKASDKAVGGATMVSYSLPNRHPLNHNDWNIRNPGYTCGNVNGQVKIAITVNNAGNVEKAEVLNSQGATSCMIRRAKEYALKSRFNYSSNASQKQEGVITYRFVYRE